MFYNNVKLKLSFCKIGNSLTKYLVWTFFPDANKVMLRYLFNIFLMIETISAAESV